MGDASFTYLSRFTQLDNVHGEWHNLLVEADKSLIVVELLHQLVEEVRCFLTSQSILAQNGLIRAEILQKRQQELFIICCKNSTEEHDHL